MSDNMKMYCNPLPLPSIPLGSDGWKPMAFTGEPEREYRSISDPSVLYDGGKWYMYPSYGMAWYTEDFATWHHKRVEPFDMKYSPDVIPFRGRYIMTSHTHGLYESNGPLDDFRYLGDFILPDGTGFKPIDPCLFVDDDGRLYMFFFQMREGKHKRAFISGSFGCELDGDDPRRVISEIKCIHEFDPEHEWERFGEKRQDTVCGWIEGQWVLKRNGRYYLVYATSGTEFTNYCLAAYYSDVSPLEGFVCQKRNPVTLSKSKLISGAGHGCITEGPNGTLWAFYTTSVNITHIYERFVGMDLIDIDENGELYAPHGVTDTPQLAPGIAEDPVSNNDGGFYPLTTRMRGMIRASSAVYGREAYYALDENLMTFWEPEHSDEKPSITVNLMAPYKVSAMRLIWRDIGLDSKNGAVGGPFGYIVEGCFDADKEEWFTLADCSGNGEDMTVDFRQFEEKTVELVRLTVISHPEKIYPGVIDFTVFGVRNEEL